MTNTDALDQINDTVTALGEALSLELTDDQRDNLTHTLARALGVEVPQPSTTVLPHVGPSDTELAAQGLKAITVQWEESVTYEQIFEVPEDFDVDAAIEEGDDEDGPLHQLIVQEGDFTVVYATNERTVTYVQDSEGTAHYL